MLTADRDTGRAITRYNNVVYKAREWGNAANEESDNGSPVASVSGRITVDTVEVVHIRYGHIATSDDIVAAVQDKRISEYERDEGGLSGILGDLLSHENGCHRT
jgi:hypothetical protein